MPGWTRQQVDGLTYDELVGVLTEYDWQEQDRRHWNWALKASDPFEAYSEMRRAVEDQMAPAEPIPANRKSWFEAT